jgi:hypothetical protein
MSATLPVTVVVPTIGRLELLEAFSRPSPLASRGAARWPTGRLP